MTPAPDAELLPPIVQVGHPVLRTAAADVSATEIETPAFRDLVAIMVAVMRKAPGVGLAAPQIGISKRVLVFEDRAEFLTGVDPSALASRERAPLPLTVLANPTIRLVGGETATFLEGCLSVSGYGALVERALEVEVTGIDATTEHAKPGVWRFRGWPARILQHEVDHLAGTLYVDRMYSRSFLGPEALRSSAGRTTADIAEELGVALPTKGRSHEPTSY